MPDITMCTNKECLLSKGCYRYRAVPSGLMQSYAVFKAASAEHVCEHSMEMQGRRVAPVE